MTRLNFQSSVLRMFSRALCCIFMAHGLVIYSQIPCLTTASAGELSAEPKYSAVWIFFYDKNGVTDWDMDDPVDESYISFVRDHSLNLRTVSRWFNAVSAEINTSELDYITGQPFVSEVTPVARFRRIPPEPSPAVAPRPLPKKALTHSLDYGRSYFQLNSLHIPELHDRGYTGKDVKVAVLDNGFNGIDHEAFDSLRIGGAWNFVENTEDVSGWAHGTEVLSIIAAFKPGSLIGGAWGATYYLAKTEVEISETPIEEDYWVAGAEWASSKGVDILHSSLGYTIWDDGSGYTYRDLDGNTAISTLAARELIRRGIVVVCSAGNYGDKAWRYITPPGDADGVISVGAVDTNGNISPFSSFGPTYDGRIKPELVAQGSETYMVNTNSINEFYYKSGTSYSAPLITGACALLKEIHPDWGPTEILENLKNSALDLGPEGPDNRYGWGLPDVLLASIQHITVFSGNNLKRYIGENMPELLQVLVKDENGQPWEGVTVTFNVEEGTANLFDYNVITSDDGIAGTMLILGDSLGIVRISASITVEEDTFSVDFNAQICSRAYAFPNPIKLDRLGIQYVYFPVEVESPVYNPGVLCGVSIYDQTGSLVNEKTEMITTQGPHEKTIKWDGTNFSGKRVGSGVYVYRVYVGSIDYHIGKLAVIR